MSPDALTPADIDEILARARRHNTIGRRYCEGDEADVRDLVREIERLRAELDEATKVGTT